MLVYIKQVVNYIRSFKLYNKGQAMQDFIDGCTLIFKNDADSMKYAGHDVIFISGSMGDLDDWPADVVEKLESLGFHWSDSSWAYYT